MLLLKVSTTVERERAAEYFGNGAALWKSWKEWAERSNEPAGSRKAFTQKMEAHGYRRDKYQEKRGYWGIDLELPLVDEEPE